MKNHIFIEGLQGSGKTTLLRKLSGKYPEYKAYYEGDISPVELAWCSYMTKQELDRVLMKYPHLEQEIWQNTKQEGDYFITSYTRILAECREFYELMEEQEIVDFYKEAYEILKPKGFKMLYLRSEHIREDILQIKRERTDEHGVELWYPLMMKYLQESPYGKAHGYRNLNDMLAHFERRCGIEERIIREVLGEDCTVLKAKDFVLDGI